MEESETHYKLITLFHDSTPVNETVGELENALLELLDSWRTLIGVVTCTYTCGVFPDVSELLLIYIHDTKSEAERDIKWKNINLDTTQVALAKQYQV